ncbi:MAG: NAD(P)/FAD-dependent oxidoreductase, partial [archaeon]|nr:NAD(P)/FAD-dependent oxidoreductase [archaeon]
ISPDLHTELITQYSDEDREIGVDRKILLDHLISIAEKAGVKFQFNEEILSPIIENDCIIGLKTSKGEEKADLIIDAAGLDSPVRKQLPLKYKIIKDVQRGYAFYSYRGYFDLINQDRLRTELFQAFLGFNDIRGIAWYRIKEPNISDIFFGQIDPLTKSDVKNLMDKMHEINPSLGEKSVREGQFAKIPIRRTLERIVGPNYAAVGDSATMTIPVIGSGIENSMKAGKMLADVIIEADSNVISEKGYSTESLWSYQYRYFKEIGGEMVKIDYLKCYIMTLPWSAFNFLLKKGVITPKELEAGLAGEEITIKVGDLIGKVIRGISHLTDLLNLKFAIDRLEKAKKAALSIPETFSEEKVQLWAKKLNKYFAKFEKKLLTVK